MTNTDTTLSQNNKSKKPFVIAGVLALVAIAVIAIAFVSSSAHPATKIGVVKATVNAEGFNPETSTPVSLAVYEGDVKDKLVNDDEANDPKPLDEVSCNANEAIEIESLAEEGTYTVAVSAAPILEDGTVYEASEPQVIELADKDINLTFDCKVMDLEEASEEEVAAATEAAAQAAENSGNETATAAVAAAANKAGVKAPSAPSKPASSNNNSGSSNNNSNSSAPSNSSSAPSQPAHTHNWVAQTKTVHHDAVYKTVHHDAVTESVLICDKCGAVNPSRDHLKNHAINDGGYSTHREERVIKDAYDEQVLVNGAYDETVTTGYKCSSCGAIK